MQDTSTVAIVAMLASMAAVTNQAYASPWVPDLMIRAEPSDESSAKPEGEYYKVQTPPPNNKHTLFPN